METSVRPIGMNCNTRITVQNTPSTTVEPVHRLSDDIVKYLFSFIGIRSSAILRLVCKRWKILLDQERTWSILLSSSIAVAPGNLQLFIEKSKKNSWRLQQLKSQFIHSHLRLKAFDYSFPVFDRIFFEDNKIIVNHRPNDYQISVFDLPTAELRDWVKYEQGSFVVSRGVIYLNDYRDHSVSAFHLKDERQIWSYTYTSASSIIMHVNEERNHLYLFRSQSAANTKKALNTYIFALDLTDGTPRWKKKLTMNSLIFHKVCGDYLYLVDNNNNATSINFYCINLNEAHSKSLAFFSQEKTEERIQIIGALQSNVHILCSQHELFVAQFSQNTCNRTFVYKLESHLSYVNRTPNILVHALIEDLLCLQVYNSEKEEYFLQFWDMGACTLIKEYKIPVRLEYIFYLNRKMIGIATDHTIYSIEFIEEEEVLSSKFQSCAII